MNGCQGDSFHAWEHEWIGDTVHKPLTLVLEHAFPKAVHFDTALPIHIQYFPSSY